MVGGISPWRDGWVAVGSEAVDQVFAVGRAKAWYSMDAAQWSEATVDGFALGQVVAGADGLLAVGAPSGCGGCVGPRALWRSDDGRSWASIGPDSAYGGFATNGVHIVRLGQDGTLDDSLDGVHWTSLAKSLPGKEHLGHSVGSRGILLLEQGPGGTTRRDQTDGGVRYLPAN